MHCRRANGVRSRQENQEVAKLPERTQERRERRNQESGPMAYRLSLKVISRH